MTTADPRLALFLDQRPRLRLLAYRLLGDVAEADDTLQDCWLKWRAVAVEQTRDPAAFLTTQVTRLALDRLRKARRCRQLLAQWLPEPWVEPVPDGEADLSTGLMLLLERLGPDQRAVYVLREAMDLDFAQIAAVLDKSAATCRQIMARARAALKGEPRYAWDMMETAALVRRFAAACEQRDYAALVALLGQDARLISHAGTRGKAARNPIVGSDHVSRFFLGVWRKFLPADFGLRPLLVNGLPALAGEAAGQVRWVLTFGCRDGRIERVFLMADPDKLPPAGGGQAT